MAGLQPILPAVNMTFFGLAGASLRLVRLPWPRPPVKAPKLYLKLLEVECCGQAPLLGTLWAAMIVWLVRLVAIFLGSWLGAYMGGSTVDHRRRIWQGMITQVGRLCTVQLHSAVLGRNAKV